MKLVRQVVRFNLWTRWVFLAAAIVLTATAYQRPAGLPWFLGAAAVYYVFVMVGYSVGMHRYFAHRSFHTSRFWESVMLGSVVVSLGGVPFTWVRAHLLHHKHSDTPEDPYRVATRGWHSIYLPYDPHLSRDRVRRWLADPLQRWSNTLYFAWVALYIGLAALAFGWAGVTWLWAVPVVFLHTFRQFFFHFSIHKWGYRNHETPDNSRNNWVIALLTGGEGWHNNHHESPASWSFQQKWWEIDFGGLFIRAIRSAEPKFEVVRDELADSPPVNPESMRTADAG